MKTVITMHDTNVFEAYVYNISCMLKKKKSTNYKCQIKMKLNQKQTQNSPTN